MEKYTKQKNQNEKTTKKPLIFFLILTLFVILAIGIVFIFNYNQKRSGYFDGNTWEMTYDEIYDKYEKYDIRGDEDVLWCNIPNYSYCGLRGEATISFWFENEELSMIDVIFEECENSTEQLKLYFDKYYEVSSMRFTYEHNYISSNSLISLGEVSNDCSIIGYFNRNFIDIVVK